MSKTLTTPADVAASLGLSRARENFKGNALPYPRNFMGNKFVYLTISPRARGLSIGINLNPDAFCNFSCIYCDVDRSVPRPGIPLDCDVAGRELVQTLALVQEEGLRGIPPYTQIPRELLRLRHVALSGEGEPTASPQFLEAVETVVHIRARAAFPFFKIVLITNASQLDSPAVQEGLRLFTLQDEIWAKLDAGTQTSMDKINQPLVPLEKIISNIVELGRKRPVIIQSLFSLIHLNPPTEEEIDEYIERLKEMKHAGANISKVQVYSAARPTASGRIEHLSLMQMSQIASRITGEALLPAEVF
ncbi:MAG: radical SAM protein [Verrucomicrobiota bacterium]|nr:radical SAM protein [Verrucomicrobiota bacterium]